MYGIRPAKHVEGRVILELTGIGGGLEPGDQSLSTGVIREAREEIDSTVRLLSCSETIIVRAQGGVERIDLEGSERPAAVVFRNYRTPPHQPWHERNKGKACLVVFAAELEGHPRPAGELPYLIWLRPADILHVAREDVPLHALLHAGAELVVGTRGAPQQDSLTRLTDSQEALALALGDEVLNFYRSVGRGSTASW